MTPYRQPGERPPAAPTTTLLVSRFGVGVGRGVFLGTLLLSAYGVYVSYVGSSIDCVRRSVGAVPTCTVTQHAITHRAIPPFELHETSLVARERSDDEGPDVVLTTPEGDITAGVTPEFAVAAADGARRFATTPAELHWSASRANWGTTCLVALMVAGIIALMRAVTKPTRLVLDRDAQVIRVGRSSVYALAHVRAAKVEEIEDADIVTLGLVDRNDRQQVIAKARRDEAEAAAAAIDAFLATR